LSAASVSFLLLIKQYPLEISSGRKRDGQENMCFTQFWCVWTTYHLPTKGGFCAWIASLNSDLLSKWDTKVLQVVNWTGTWSYKRTLLHSMLHVRFYDKMLRMTWKAKHAGEGQMKLKSLDAYANYMFGSCGLALRTIRLYYSAG
jgi:hypothetical protein